MPESELTCTTTRKGAITMPTVTIEEAKNTLSELIHRLTPGEEVVITENDQPIARLMAATPPCEPRKVPRLGTLRGTVLSMEHFDDPLEDFKEYME
jgi:antitoxin (DNA-binding transcriptional repressor) of toxin-antitoxin stability system